MNDLTKQRIIDHISPIMDRLIKRRVVDEPFNAAEIEARNPFGFRLVPEEVWKGSKFERSFVTSLGQGIFEQMSKIVAEGTGAFSSNQHDTTFNINTWRNEKIEEILTDQRASRRPPNWNQEVTDILSLTNQTFTEVTVKFDLYIRRSNGREEFYGLKTVKPNLDQAERAKRDMLRMMTRENNSEAYFALPFNPGGEGEPYRKGGHSIPYKIFDMDNDPSVLIGGEFWNKVGDSPDTYNELLDLFSRLGNKYSDIIRRDYFEIDIEQ
ncbi:TdeIII family type II restriction endonuclease [Sporosarcina sp. G11-34]|uniref:TdeIII family type II restriction endonuclease n=1 Tax=Sporosarcina sp. G11-34 TaxID=2849605 RepID=UPI0022A94266|nr:TdeIII family type II restriction endonuclease [Sporosarcina sp. G11-34]MCZ2260775.1 TdeIII family type II restriction endonuclease [Sporosarcina sp. G11-34]